MSSQQLMVRVLGEQCLVEEDADAVTSEIAIKSNSKAASDFLLPCMAVTTKIAKRTALTKAKLTISIAYSSQGTYVW